MSASMSSCSADPWGMCKRQCVSYTAFMVDKKYGNMPNWGGYGNANQWADNARTPAFPRVPFLKLELSVFNTVEHMATWPGLSPLMMTVR